LKSPKEEHGKKSTPAAARAGNHTARELDAAGDRLE